MNGRALCVRGLLITAGLLLGLAHARAASHALVFYPGTYAAPSGPSFHPARNGRSSVRDGGTALTSSSIVHLPGTVGNTETRFSARGLAETVTATVSIQPVTSVVVLNRTFTVSVVISDVVNLGAFQFDLRYDPAVIQGVDATLGPFLSSTGRSGHPTGLRIDDEAGVLSFGAYSLSYPPQRGPDGSGVLAEVALTGRSTEVSTLDLERVQVLDPTAAQQPSAAADGTAFVVVPRYYLPLVSSP